MGYQQQCSLIVLEVIFQPHNGLEIQVVGRLVQNQQIRFLQQQPCNGKPCFFAAAETGDDAGIGFLCETHTVQHRADLHVDLIAAVVFEPGLQAVIFLRTGHVTGLHGFFQLVHSLLRFQQRTKHAPHLLPDGAFPIQSAHLFQIADAGLGGSGNFAVPLHQMIRQFLFREDPQQRGLAAAIYAHKPDAVVVFHRQ